MQIQNVSSEVVQAEQEIRIRLERYKLDSVLLGIRNASDLKPFVAAGLGMLAVRYCRSLHEKENPNRVIEKGLLNELVHFATLYLLNDPAPFADPNGVNTSSISILLRTVGSQFPYGISWPGQFGRAYFMYEQLPMIIASSPGVPYFDLESAFRNSYQTSISDFIKVAAVACSAASSKNSLGFDIEYFHKARLDGLRMPKDSEICSALEYLSANSTKLVHIYNQYRSDDHRFAAYDFNPLFRHPLIRPWRRGKHSQKLIAPVPNLIAQRVSIGVFYHLRADYSSSFTEYFGHLFEAYVGVLLRTFTNSTSVFSERDIRQRYSIDRGKVPDWVIVEGKTAILIECKATSFNRLALSTAAEEQIDKSLRQVQKSLQQLHEFREACMMKTRGLEAFMECTAFEPIVITLEQLYLINSGWFRDYVDSRLHSNMRNLPWHILSVEELEAFQPHAAAGYSVIEFFKQLGKDTFPHVIKRVEDKTNCTFKDSWLHEQEMTIWDSLGVPRDELEST